MLFAFVQKIAADRQTSSGRIKQKLKQKYKRISADYQAGVAKRQTELAQIQMLLKPNRVLKRQKEKGLQQKIKNRKQ